MVKNFFVKIDFNWKEILLFCIDGVFVVFGNIFEFVILGNKGV